MFGRKKQIKIQNKIITDINNILKEDNVTEEEYEALIRVKKRLLKGEYMQRVLKDFLIELRPSALQSKLSPSVAKFYGNIINEAFKNSGWGGLILM